MEDPLIGSVFNEIGLFRFKIFRVMRSGSSKRNSMGLDMILATYGWGESANMNNNVIALIACKDGIFCIFHANKRSLCNLRKCFVKQY